jgi:hypothetical protein
MSTVDHRQELLNAFHIGPDDLAANRAGVLGAAQKHRLRRGAYWNLAGGLLLGGLMLAIMYLVVDKPLAPVQWIVGGGLAAAGLAVGVHQFVRLNQAADRAVVECVSGPARVWMIKRAGWYVSVNDESFKLPIAFWHLPAEAPYRVYVAAPTRRIVAMEPDGWG